MVDHCCDTHVLVVHFYVFKKLPVPSENSLDLNSARQETHFDTTFDVCGGGS